MRVSRRRGRDSLEAGVTGKQDGRSVTVLGCTEQSRQENTRGEGCGWAPPSISRIMVSRS